MGCWLIHQSKVPTMLGIVDLKPQLKTGKHETWNHQSNLECVLPLKPIIFFGCYNINMHTHIYCIYNICITIYTTVLVRIMFLFHVITSYWTTYISLRSRFWGPQELNQGGHSACAEGDYGLSLVGKKRPTLDTPQEKKMGRFIKMHGTWNSLHLPWNIL
jgi:hypothetical protein